MVLAVFLNRAHPLYLDDFGWNRGGCGNNNNCNAVSNCQVEKQEIIDAARTQYMIENTSRITQEQTAAGLTALGNKIDYYAYQDLRDQLAQERTKNVVLENRVYSDTQFNALRAQIEAIGCSMLKRPEVTVSVQFARTLVSSTA